MLTLHNPEETSLFPRLPESVIDQFRPHAEQLSFFDGQTLFEEAVSDYDLYIVLQGGVRISRRIANRNTVLTVHEPGEFTGEIFLLACEKSLVSGHAVGHVTVLRVPAARVRQLVAECNPLAQQLLAAMAGRTRDTEAQLRQQEKLAALGKLAAGLAHELNNPAAALLRGASSLRDAIGQMQSLIAAPATGNSAVPDGAVKIIQDALTRARADLSAAVRPVYDPFDQSLQEDDLVDWLNSAGVAHAFDLAPTLVKAGLTRAELEKQLGGWEHASLTNALVWCEMMLRMQDFGREIESSARRMSDVVHAMKSYTYMDQAGQKYVNLHDGLDMTVKVMEQRFKGQIKVIREYEPDLPALLAYPGELNQAWTNLIENAWDAMDGTGTLTVRTAREAESIAVEICDTGKGIPAENLGRVFEPFFTTKEVGQGLGLGLDAVYRIIVHHHRGAIHLSSRPGDTRFHIRIPFKH